MEPGAFRTDWAGRSLRIAGRIDAYPDRGEQIHRYDGSQPGDPRKAAHAMLWAADAQEPPLRLLLGPDAYDSIVDKLSKMSADLRRWEHVSRSTSFDDPGGVADAMQAVHP